MIKKVMIIYFAVLASAAMFLEIISGVYITQYLVFMVVVGIISCLGKVIPEKSLKQLVIRREINKNGIFEGEELKITTVIENRKRLPIPLLIINEEIPLELEYAVNEYAALAPANEKRVNKYSVSGHERLRSKVVVQAQKRGTYIIRNMEVTIGDPFGLFANHQKIDDLIEILVFPKLMHINDFNFQNMSLQGEQVIKRWIHQDPLYIKGIREYNVEDRMKDIHWKSSLKMNKLMVKEYDHTSERSIVIIVNIYSGSNLWLKPDYSGIDNGLKLGISIIKSALDQGIPAGLWTNAQVTSYHEHYKAEIWPSLNSLKTVLELAARMCYYHRTSLHKYLGEKAYAFNKDTNYILVTTYIDEESINTLRKLKRLGYMISIIDSSTETDLPDIKGIEKIKCCGVREGLN